VFTVVCQEVSVWEGNDVATLFVPNAPAPALTTAQLSALGSSPEFQQLLTIAAQDNLISGAEAIIPSASPATSSN
jgi:hypothetical protein